MPGTRGGLPRERPTGVEHSRASEPAGGTDSALPRKLQPPHSVMNEFTVTEIEGLKGKTIKRIGFMEGNRSLIVETDDGCVDIGAFGPSGNDAPMSIEDVTAVPLRWVKP